MSDNLVLIDAFYPHIRPISNKKKPNLNSLKIALKCPQTTALQRAYIAIPDKSMKSDTGLQSTTDKPDEIESN